MTLKAYMVSDVSPESGAVLVFAHSAREARKVGYPEVKNWDMYVEYIDIRVRWLKNSPWIFKQADKVKLDAGITHVIDDPICCKSCETWGFELNEQGYCEYCQKEIDEVI